MKLAELKSLTPEELATKIREFKEETLNLHIQKQMGQLEKNSRLREIRVAIARAYTLLNQKAQPPKQAKQLKEEVKASS